MPNEFIPNSNMDVRVEFEPGERVGYFRLARIQDQLSALIAPKLICASSDVPVACGTYG